ncbi:RNA polymerase sigma factor [Pelagibacterium xiamenense]|uniref:RNA polymerase sigma factor n=1 Tax=Pelagibacterium xiamenense TaxID=2901140 RepID=UPI001E555A7E|nr:RNA polymerase sigma factor [Pelagibacterium xiamenense]MCD7058375.1 RNA polymerase sigma factor [Pelagibacterium xiamenense]
MSHLPALRRYAYGLTGNRDAAEDLFQATVARALENQRSWRGINLRGWLFAIMTNLNRNRVRDGRRTPESVPFEDAPGLAAAGDGAEEARDPLLQRRLVAALDTLSPDMRAVLLLVVLEGYSYGEVARVLEIPMGTVMSRLSRARRGLATALRQDNIVSMTQR